MSADGNAAVRVRAEYVLESGKGATGHESTTICGLGTMLLEAGRGRIAVGLVKSTVLFDAKPKAPAQWLERLDAA